MKVFKVGLVCMLIAQMCWAQQTYTFNKYLVEPSVGGWVQFGQLNTLPTGTYVKLKIWAHYHSQLFFHEFEFAATSYGNQNLEWVEVAPKLTNGHDGTQQFALDARYKCGNSCPLELRLRRLGGGGAPGEINFILESNAVFSEANLQGSNGVVAPGYLGNSGGWKFAVSPGTFGNSTEGLFVTGNGNVGIGTVAPNSKLSVNGNIRAREIKVETANWPDYVFDKGYKLPSLLDTEKYIKEKGHLPGIPSAAEAIADGVKLGEMNKKLLEKIEELTLHLIEMKKENDLIRKKVLQLEKSELKN